MANKYTSVMITQDTLIRLHKLKHKLEMRNINDTINEIIRSKSLSQKD